MNEPRTPWLIRLALAAFPRAFRVAHVAEMEEDYAEARSACQTRAARAWLVVRTVADMVASGLRERRVAAARSKAQPPRNDQTRSSMRFTILDGLLRDLRYVARGLARRPGFTLIAVTTLALGIGANTAIFSVVNAVLLRPLEWVDPDDLVMVWRHGDDNPDARGIMSLPDIQDIADLPAVETLVAFMPSSQTVTSGEEPEMVSAARTMDGLMETFRVRPFLGRDLTVHDAEYGRPRIIVVGYRYWRERLGGRQDILGSTIELSDVPYEIVGVAPAGFDFPDGAQLWRPDQNTGCRKRSCSNWHVIGRLADDATLEAFSSQLRALATTLSDEYPDSNFGKRFRAVRLADDQVADVRRGLWFILGAVSLVLLIACANVANLMLVRGENRRGEVAVRRALGATTARLASQVLMESAMLSITGAAVGVGLARAAITLVRGMPAETVPRIETVSLDSNVLLFTLGLSAIVTMLFGLGPALRQRKGATAADLISERRGGSGPRASRSRSLLLVAETALSVLLLAGAAFMLKSFDRLYSMELGFAPENLVRFRVDLPGARYDTISRIVAFYETLEGRLAALPGVTSVASVCNPPLGGSQCAGGGVRIDGRPPPPPGTGTDGRMNFVTSSYFETMRLPIVRGRRIEPSDRTGTLPIAVVSQTFVRENFGDEDPIGKRFRLTINSDDPTWTIVGVVGDVRRDLTDYRSPDVYVPLGQLSWSWVTSLTVTMRTQAGIAPSARAIGDVLHTIDPALPVIDYETVEGALGEYVALTRFYVLSMGIFAALAVVLACVGLYGVVAYIVAQRNREIGIRMALGAQRDQVVRMVLAQGLRPAVVGVVLGLGLALAFGRVVESLLFEVSPRDPLVLSAVVGVLATVVFAASLLPARRASRIDPAVTLREP